jgi:hypothetical protein
MTPASHPRAAGSALPSGRSPPPGDTQRARPCVLGARVRPCDGPRRRLQPDDTAQWTARLSACTEGSRRDGRGLARHVRRNISSDRERLDTSVSDRRGAEPGAGRMVEVRRGRDW